MNEGLVGDDGRRGSHDPQGAGLTLAVTRRGDK